MANAQILADYILNKNSTQNNNYGSTNNHIIEHHKDINNPDDYKRPEFKDSFAPHGLNVPAAYERWDPVYSSIFRVKFTLPFVMQGEYSYDELEILSKQIIAVHGLDGIQKSLNIYKKKYLGVDVAFFNPNIEDSSVDFDIEFNLNLRNVSDNYVYKIFKEWFSIMYNMATGIRAFKDYCCADSMIILEANRDGTIWRQLILKQIFITSISGLDTLEYGQNDARKLKVGFHADYWDETVA